MATHRLVVTDITNYGDLRCVAGWDVDRNCMIRPEPSPSGFWPSTLVGPSAPFELKNLIRFSADKPDPATTFPHLTEDRVVKGAIEIEKKMAKEDYHAMIMPHAFFSLRDLFERKLIVDGMKGYVPTGSQTRSLGALKVAAKTVTVESHYPFGKHRLRISFTDSERTFAPNLTSSRAYALHQSGELDDLNVQIQTASNLLLRIGLARGFEKFPDRCYLQVNGICILD